MKGIRRVFRWRGGRDVRAEVEEELRFHLDSRRAELEAEGLGPDEAARVALREFGDRAQAVAELTSLDTRTTSRRARSEWLRGALQDLRAVLRGLRRAPALAVVVVGTLGLGIGAAVSIYSIIEGVLLRTVPARDAERLHTVGWPGWGGLPTTSGFAYAQWRDQRDVFDELAVYGDVQPVLTGEGDAVHLSGVAATPNFLPLLGARVALGRVLTSEDLERREAVVLIGWRLWRERFGGDAGVIGRTIELDGKPFTVVGVLQRGFGFPLQLDGTATELWRLMPEPAAGSGRPTLSGWLRTVARLRPGVTAEAAAARLTAQAQRLAAEQGVVLNSGLPPGMQPSAVVLSIQEQLSGHLRRPLWLMLAAVALLFVIACTNVANLLLARGVGRTGELAVRLSLGAGRARIARLLLTEAFLLALCGAAAGVALAYVALPVLLAVAGTELPLSDDVAINIRVLLVAAGAAVLATLLIGVLPAILAIRRTSFTSLRGRLAVRGSVRSRAGDGLLAAQLALAVVLLIGAGLLSRSFARAIGAAGAGIDERDVATVRASVSERHGSPEALVALADQVIERVRALPGVTTAAVSIGVPHDAGYLGGVSRSDRPDQDAPQFGVATIAATTDYFATYGITMVRGSDLAAAARRDAAVISEQVAERLFPGEDPIGQRIRTGQLGALAPVELTVVGIARDVAGLGYNEGAWRTEPAMHVYVPFDVAPSRYYFSISARTQRPRALLEPMRAVLRELDSATPVWQQVTFTQHIGNRFAEIRLFRRLLGIFAGLSTFIALAGVFAVSLYSVTRSTHELGVRAALGARAGQLIAGIIGRVASPAAAGLVIGIAAAAFTADLLATLLFDTPPLDPAVFGGAAALLLCAALLAAALPAARVMRIDPARVLREE